MSSYGEEAEDAACGKEETCALSGIFWKIFLNFKIKNIHQNIILKGIKLNTILKCFNWKKILIISTKRECVEPFTCGISREAEYA